MEQLRGSTAPVCAWCGEPTKRNDFFGEGQPPVFWCSRCMEATPAPVPPVRRVVSELESPSSDAYERRRRRVLTYTALLLLALAYFLGRALWQ